MDAKDLREIGNALSDSLSAEGGSLEAIRLQLGRIVSHLQSEQASRVALNQTVADMGKLVQQHDRALFGDRENIEVHPGIVQQTAEIIRNQKRNHKLLWTIITGVATAVVIEVIKLLK